MYEVLVYQVAGYMNIILACWKKTTRYNTRNVREHDVLAAQPEESSCHFLGSLSDVESRELLSRRLAGLQNIKHLVLTFYRFFIMGLVYE